MNEIKLPSPSKKEVSFVSQFGLSRANLVLGSCGLDGAGKTRLGVTGPRITGIIPTDRKTRKVVEHVMKELGKEFGRDILMPTEGHLPTAKPTALALMNEDDSKVFYQGYAVAIEEAAWAMYDHQEVRMIVVDQFAQYCSAVEWATYGRKGHKVLRVGTELYKDYKESNQRIVDFISSLSGKVLLLVHRAKAEYNKGGKATGRMTWAEGYRNLGNEVDVLIHQERNLKYNPEFQDDEDRGWQYGVNVNTCNLQPHLQGPDGLHKNTGLRDDMINMNSVLGLTFPDLNTDAWEW